MYVDLNLGLFYIVKVNKDFFLKINFIKSYGDLNMFLWLMNYLLIIIVFILSCYKIDKMLFFILIKNCIVCFFLLVDVDKC